MTPEKKFLFYRKHIADSEFRLSTIHQAAVWLMEIHVEIPTVVAANLEQSVHFDSRSDEYDAIEEFRDHIEAGAVEFFHPTTLQLLTSAGMRDYNDGGGVTCRNIIHRVASIRKDTQGYPYDESWMEGIETNLSFAGFLPTEVDSVLSSMKRKAEGRLEKLRDIHTQMKYMKKEHIWPNAQLVKLAPECSIEVLHRAEPKWGEPWVLSSWWMTTVGFNPDMAEQMLDAFRTIDRCAEPREGEPNTTDYFGSHISNKTSVEAYE